jgi:hypothetical protein
MVSLDVFSGYENRISRNGLDISGVLQNLLVAIVTKYPGTMAKTRYSLAADVRAMRASAARAIWRGPASAITAARRRGNSQSGNRDAATKFPKFGVTEPCAGAKLKDFTGEFRKTPCT